MMTGFLMLFALLCLSCCQGFIPPARKSMKRMMIPAMMTPVSQDVLSSCAALGGSVVWLQIWITLAKEGKIDSRLSRKIIHCGSVPLFIFVWPFYSSNDFTSRAIAAAIPLVQMIRLILAGTKSDSSGVKAVKVNDIEAGTVVNALSRSGSKTEALGGPLIYTTVLFLCTLLFFRDSPIGVVAMTQMAAGDGIADIIGRRFGTAKWPFSEKKSYIGSAAFVVGAFVVCAVLLSYLSANGLMIGFDVVKKLPQLLVISILCALVELIPIGDDNISVPLAGAALSYFLL